MVRVVEAALEPGVSVVGLKVAVALPGRPLVVKLMALLNAPF